MGSDGSGNEAMLGPMTLTHNGASVTAPGRGVPSGNDRSGYNLHFSIQGRPGDDPALPNCYIIGTVNEPTPLQQPYNSIATPPFDITYNNCQGFIAPPPQRTSVTESARLTLSK